MRGNITRRGKVSWRLKFDIEPDATGKRRFHTVTIRGTRKKAEEELARLLNDAHRGTLVDQNRDSVATYLRSWLNGQHDLAPSSIERYRDIIERQTIPFLGDIELQKLKPVHVRDWLVKLRKAGRRQLSAQKRDMRLSCFACRSE
jgi:integrase